MAFTLLPNNLGCLANLAKASINYGAASGIHVIIDGEKFRCEVTDACALCGIVEGECELSHQYPSVPSLDSMQEIKECVISAESWKNAFAAAGKIKPRLKPILSNLAVGIDSAGREIRLVSTNMETVNDMITNSLDERFPPIDKIMPKGNPTVFHVNPDFLIKLLEVGRRFTDTDSNKVTIQLFPPKNEKQSSLVMVTASNRQQKFTGLVMSLTEPVKPEKFTDE